MLFRKAIRCPGGGTSENEGREKYDVKNNAYIEELGWSIIEDLTCRRYLDPNKAIGPADISST